LLWQKKKKKAQGPFFLYCGAFVVGTNIQASMPKRKKSRSMPVKDLPFLPREKEKTDQKTPCNNHHQSTKEKSFNFKPESIV
jgi:hypothetical protein